jgi:hypothetical protein
MARFSRKQVLPVIVAVIVLGGTVAGYFYWAHAQKADPLAGLSPGMAEVTRAGETLPLPATR